MWRPLETILGSICGRFRVGRMPIWCRLRVDTGPIFREFVADLSSIRHRYCVALGSLLRRHGLGSSLSACTHTWPRLRSSDAPGGRSFCPPALQSGAPSMFGSAGRPPHEFPSPAPLGGVRVEIEVRGAANLARSPPRLVAWAVGLLGANVSTDREGVWSEHTHAPSHVYARVHACVYSHTCARLPN